ncbi:amidohydrolase family protein [Limimaricola pyoseonensis]|uniref:Cytosine/adenosine deaminase n=1 Tax=Limimaricola pyoseonensis TaxID=521013 RepID=A0A1G7FL86_9RHOB|nr:amidohydrolase family protein [Limimaricola pyoseonensis]SDE76628.1 Cytosine/adenosine deaminase [Limimaricola pyoseonensis]
MTALAADLWWPHPGHGAPEGPCRIDFDPGPRARPGQGGTGRIALSAPVNGHDHGYGLRTLDFGAPDDALEPWIAGLRLRPRTDPHLEALVAFARLARAGCAGTVHCHNSLNAAALVDEAGAVVRAAREVGLRLALSCPLLDAAPLVYGGAAAYRASLPAGDADWLDRLLPSYAPVPEQIAAVEEVMRRHQGPGVDVQFGPIGPQWCSDAMLAAVAAASERTGRRIHMHLLESPRQPDWLDRRFPQGVVAHLDAIGFLSPRLTVAHGVQLTAAEADLLAERGVRLASNPSANLRLRSGILPGAVRARMATGIGLDGTGFDDAQDIWAEMRLFHLLQSGRGLDPALTAAETFEAACGVNADIGAMPRGRDVVTLDWAALTADALWPDEDPAGRILARAGAAHVRDLVVEGRAVLRDGVLTGLDFDAARAELLAQARADLPRLEALRPVARRLAALTRAHYRTTT